MTFHHILCHGERISYLISATIALRELEASLAGIHSGVRASTLGVSQSLSLSLYGGHSHSVSGGLGVVRLEWVSFYHILGDCHLRSDLTLTTVVSRESQGSTAGVRTKGVDIGKGLSLGVNGGLGLVIGILLRYGRRERITVNHPIIYRISTTSSSTTIVTGKRTCISTGIYRHLLALTFHVSHILTLSLDGGLSLIVGVFLRYGRPEISCHHSLIHDNLGAVLGLITVITSELLIIPTVVDRLLLTLTF